ncbi:polysaccharide deacetylase family protein [Neobacillus fumarioli]|uniref:polysaccharide deacetylase family protein n=1 Tax=Neobacillus fumarioli TaxID=105229 RepID=UPI00082C92FD|nr:polysaccharide deacetylase family protein [Neobacillus fumarioli]
MKKKIALFIPLLIVVGLVIVGFKGYTKFNHIRSLKAKKPKAIVVKNVDVNVGKYLVTNKKVVPIYESLDGRLINIASLSNGQEINSNGEYGSDWYEVRVGNNYGLVSKKDVILSTNSKHLGDDLNKHPNIKYYITLASTPVCSNHTGSVVQFASLPKDERFPMSEFDKNWLTIDIAGKIGYVKRTAVKLDYGIPVLAYHHLLEKNENKLFKKSDTTITPESFNQQMRYLSQQHFASITTGDLENYLNGKIILPKNTVLITFDDGLQSVYRYAYPVLKKYNLKATEFMITGRIEKTPSKWDPDKLNALSYPEMNQMKDVFEFNSHTNNLHNLNGNKKSDVVTKPYNIVKADLALSKKILNAHSFAYPFGQYNKQTIQILKDLGYKSAFTTAEGYAKMGDNPYTIPRIIVGPKETLNLFKYTVNL